MNQKKITILIITSFALVGCSFYKTPSPATQPVPKPSTTMTEAEAQKIAEKTCIKGGEALSSGGTYNANSKTWWFDANLNATKPGCNPACVVSESTKSAEVNWQCTGLIPENTPKETVCTDEQRKGDVCTQNYDPVCATVEIQCIKAPCNPVEQTFSNSCEACHNGLVKSYRAGACDKEDYTTCVEDCDNKFGPHDTGTNTNPASGITAGDDCRLGCAKISPE